jgi:hypothetical protein
MAISSTDEKRSSAEQIHEKLVHSSAADVRLLAELVASKPFGDLDGETALQVRDIALRIGAETLQTALDEQAKATTVFAPEYSPALIAVAGDLCADWFTIPVTPDPSSRFQWSSSPRTHIGWCPGGAWLLAELVERASGQPVLRPPLLSNYDPRLDRVVRSLFELKYFPAGRFGRRRDDRRIIRIDRLGGFDGPESNPLLIAPGGGEPCPRLLVLQDDGNGFGDNSSAWPAALKDGSAETVILKMHRPSCSGNLLKALASMEKARRIKVITAEDLRADGVMVSRRLSWERTASELVSQLKVNGGLIELMRWGELVVLFGQDGAVHFKPGHVNHLYYDPLMVEHGHAELFPGRMIGTTAAFVACLAAALGTNRSESDGIRAGLGAARRWQEIGFGVDATAVQYPYDAVVNPPSSSFHDIAIPTTPTGIANFGGWSILRDKLKGSLEQIASRIVIEGESAALPGVPMGQFGGLHSIDWKEIEDYRCLQNLVRAYCDDSAPERPLSIAVFGKPGAGKTRGIRELSKDVAPLVVVPLEYDLTQFAGPDQLATAFHRTRDLSLSGKLPLVFFDEFDSPFGEALGWLKYFLAPMQDGVFTAGHMPHPIGKAIFVFIGGTCDTFKRFAEHALLAKDQKGPDFISRLRGYVNVRGPDQSDPDDWQFILRRAVAFRSLLKKKARHIFDGERARVDQDLLRALLLIPRYEHGIRSMEAILDMSRLGGLRSLEKSSLPPTTQLHLHIPDPDLFHRFVLQRQHFETQIASLAEKIHQYHRDISAADKLSTDPNMQEWEKAPPRLRDLNLARARSIPGHLAAVGLGWRPNTGTPDAVRMLKRDEIDRLAQRFHEEWLRLRNHSESNQNAVQWNLLEPQIQERNRLMAEQIPSLFDQVGYELYRLRQDEGVEVSAHLVPESVDQN